jgi:hypothetical protein
MTNRFERNGRAPAAIKVALVALTMGGGLALGLGRERPSTVAAQTVDSNSSEATMIRGAHTVTLYKSPTCTCCGKWGDHLRENGFVVREEISEDVPAIMEERGVPMHLRSCHLGVVDGYTLVGHVPADVAVRLLNERLEVSGIAVPGMPLGSPGMESLGGKHLYDVIAFGDGVEYVIESR